MATDKLGHGRCGFGCAGQAVYTRSSGGKLKCDCSYCDRHGYADQGGEGEAAWLALIDKPATGRAPAAAPAPAAPAPAPRAGVFSGLKL